MALSLSFYALYPLGIKNPHEGYVDARRTWNGEDCCGYAEQSHINDSLFVSELIKKIISENVINLKQVYVIGFSNGGLLAYRLACEHGDMLAAIATFSSGPGSWQGCASSAFVPVIRFVTDYKNLEESIKNSSLSWGMCPNPNAERDTITAIYNGKNFDGIKIINKCNSSEEIQYHINIGEHFWPPLEDIQIDSQDVVDLIWHFFTNDR